MTRRHDSGPNSTPQLETPQTKISDAELAVFLRQLAAIYRSLKTGNLPLSNALNELASWIKRRVPAGENQPKLRGPKAPTEPPLDLSQLKALDAIGIEKFLADEGKTKLELVDLASARFSIPRSQLMRQKTSAVRQTIRAALLHEGSIAIISQEAQRDGSKRSS